MTTRDGAPSGYPRTILVDVSLAPSFTCGKCDQLLVNPVQIHECGHRYCEPCVDHILRGEESVSCLTCLSEDAEEKQVITTQSYLPDYACRRALDRLQVTCVYINAGCEFGGKLSALEEHLRVCLYVIITCVCGLSLPRGEHQTHMEHDCPQSRLSRRCRFGCPDENLGNDAEAGDHNERAIVRHLALLHDDVIRTRGDTLESLQQMGSRVEDLERTPRQTAVAATAHGGVASEGNSPQNNVVMVEGRKSMKVMSDKFKVVLNLFSVLMKEVEQASRRMAGLETHIQRTVSEQEARVIDLRAALDKVEGIYNGIMLWKIGDVRRKTQEAEHAQHASILSEPFYTSRAGYKLCGRIYLNGDGIGRGKFLSLFIVMMRGKYDAMLEWPFNQFVTLTLIDRSGQGCHVRDSFRTDPSSSSFRRPTTEMNIASGCPQFMSLQDLKKNQDKYIVDDTLFLEIRVDTHGLENYGGQGI